MFADKKLSETEQIRVAYERMQIMFDTSPFGVHIWNQDLKMIYCNQATVSLLKISDKQEYLDRFEDFSPEFQPDGRLSKDAAGSYIQEAFDEGNLCVEWTHKTLTGELIPTEMTLVRIDHKDDCFVVAYVRDLRGQERMKHILNNIDELIYVSDPNTNEILFVNSAMRRHYNIEGDGVGQLCYKVFEEGINQRCYGCPCEKLDKEPDKTFIWEEFSNLTKRIYRNVDRYINWLDGRMVHMQHSVDITELVKSKEQAERQRIEAESANKAKSDFLSHISHEIRTPMNAVIGTAEIALQKETNAPEIEEAFNMIYTSGNLLLNIINDMLDLSKIEAGKLEIMPARYDIPSIIYDTVQLNLLRYESKPIDFELKIDEHTPLDMLGDELRIKQILNNILSNAFKYTDKGRVELSVAAETESGTSVKDPNAHSDCVLVLRITDTGQGMTESQISKLFEEYTRFNMNANRAVVGTGLGMHITKRIIDAMGGEIFVESELEKGSVFTVRLPQTCIGFAKCGAELADNLRKSRFKSTLKLNRSQIMHEYMPYGSVLIVDDVESNLYVAKGMMLPYGLAVETVSSGIEAVDKIKSGRQYDIVFMDHMMPHMNGVEATRIIRDTGYTSQIVALTANAVAGASEVFLANGFDGYLSKPIDLRELNAMLNRLIRDKQTPEVIESARKEVERKKTASVPEAVRKVLMNEKLMAAGMRDVGKAIAVLEDLLLKINDLDDSDIESFTTTVHGMKSALQLIGETELSEAAYILERAGKNRKIAEISENTPAFIQALQSIIEKYKKNQPT